MTHKKNNYFLQKEITCFLVCSCLFIGCSAPEKRFIKDQLTISYQPKSTLGNEIKKLRLQHPVKISAEQMTNHLLSLQYKELTLTGKKRYIFSPSDVLEIAPIMTKALNQIKASKALHYDLETPRGKTTGIIFQANKKINWRFKSINGSNFLNSNFLNGGSTWELIPKNGQRFHKKSSVLGNKRKRNWIISNLELKVQSKRAIKLRSTNKTKRKSSTQKSARRKPSTNIQSSEKGKFEKRLEFLKELHHKQLIDNKEYKRKKLELLEQFP